MSNRLKLRRELSEGVSAWLTFERHSGREALFSEKYLALPVAQILANHFGSNVEAEHNHPVLSNLGRRGRPPQLDFVVRREGKGEVELAIETKWIGNTTVKVEDVVWDCVRLELAAHHYSCDGLFMLAGKKEEVYKALESEAFNPQTSRGNPSPILGLEGIGRWSVNIQSPKKNFGAKLHSFMRSYPKLAFPRSFICGQGTQVNRQASGQSYISAVWHIKPEHQKRYTFLVS